MCVNNLPRVALDSGEAGIMDWNSRPVDRKSSVLTTWPPSHTYKTGTKLFLNPKTECLVCVYVYFHFISILHSVLSFEYDLHSK